VTCEHDWIDTIDRRTPAGAVTMQCRKCPARREVPATSGEREDLRRLIYCPFWAAMIYAQDTGRTFLAMHTRRGGGSRLIINGPSRHEPLMVDKFIP
jgi:hypothetical protein